MRHTDVTRSIALFAVVVSASGCDFLTAKKDGSFTLSIASPSISLIQGASDTVFITITRSDYSKPVTLTVAGTPVGISALLSPSTVPSASQSSQLLLTAAGTATLGNATLTIHASGEGLAEQTATVSLTVGVTGSFSLGSSVPTAVAATGGSASATIFIIRTGGHADIVALSVTGAPANVVTAFSPSSTVGSSAALEITAAAGASVGSYPLQITGTAPGLAQQTTPISLSVIAPPSTTTFSMPFCSNSLPSWFAYQNEGYAWQALSPTSNSFNFAATARVAVAYAFVISDSSANETQLHVLYADRSELDGQSDRDCDGPKTLTGGVLGTTSGMSVRVAMGAAVATATASNPNFTLSGVADRALDLVATKGVISTSQANVSIAPDQVIIRRALNPASGSSIPALDFPSAAFAPTTSNLTVSNSTAGDLFNVASTFLTSTSTYGVVHAAQPGTTSATLYSVPAGQMLPGDLHEVLVESYQPGFSTGRTNVAYVGAVSDRTETLAPVLSNPTVSTLTATPYLRLRGLLPVQPEYPAASRFVFYQAPATGPERLVFIAVTSGYLGGTPVGNWDVVVPDFGTIFGLNANWMLAPGSVIFQVEAYAGRGPLLFGALPVAGDVVRVAYRVQTTSAFLRAQVPPFHNRLQYLRR